MRLILLAFILAAAFSSGAMIQDKRSAPALQSCFDKQTRQAGLSVFGYSAVSRLDNPVNLADRYQYRSTISPEAKKRADRMIIAGSICAGLGIPMLILGALKSESYTFQDLGPYDMIAIAGGCAAIVGVFILLPIGIMRRYGMPKHYFQVPDVEVLKER